MSNFKDRTGEIVMSKSGIPMILEVYRSSKDIDVSFQTGEYVRYTTYAKFKRGNIERKNK